MSALLMVLSLAPAQVERNPGPSWPGPHGFGFLMCLGNHLPSHGYSWDYIRSVGYSQWQTLHDNAHNPKPVRTTYAPTPDDVIEELLALLSLPVVVLPVPLPPLAGAGELEPPPGVLPLPVPSLVGAGELEPPVVPPVVPSVVPSVVSVVPSVVSPLPKSNVATALLSGEWYLKFDD